MTYPRWEGMGKNCKTIDFLRWLQLSNYFKHYEARSLSGCFAGFTEDEANTKMLNLAGAIGKHSIDKRRSRFEYFVTASLFIALPSSYRHLSTSVIVLFFGSYLVSIGPMSITIGTFASTLPFYQIPVDSQVQRYSRNNLRVYNYVKKDKVGLHRVKIIEIAYGSLVRRSN
jgi:hypothetical protein